MKTLKESLLDESLLDDFGQQTADLKRKAICDWIVRNNEYDSEFVINDDFTINIDGFHYIGKGNFPSFIQFNECNKWFVCDSCKMISLRGCPRIVHGYFRASDNNLKDLVGGPKEVTLSYYCNNCHLKSLKGAPEKVGMDFDCSYNDLTTLNGAPKRIGKGFYCRNNKLKESEIRKGQQNIGYRTFSWS